MIVAYRFSVIVQVDGQTADQVAAAERDARRDLWELLLPYPGMTLEFHFAAPWPGTRYVEFVRCDDVHAAYLLGMINADSRIRAGSGYQGLVTAAPEGE